MDLITEQKAKRFRFLARLYEVTEGNEQRDADLGQLMADLGFAQDDLNRVVSYLKSEGLIRFRRIGPGVSITHLGVVQVEKAVAEPNRPTEYFPPINIITVQQMTNSQIQQGTTNSTQTLSFSMSDLPQVAAFIDSLRRSLPDLGLAADDQAEAESEIATVEAQLASPRPKPLIIQESLKTLRNVLEGCAGSLLATHLIQTLTILIQTIR